MLKKLQVPGLLVTSPARRAGKTAVAGAIAHVLRGEGQRVAALKPVDRNAVHRREGLVSEDAELLAHRGDVRFPLDVICPVRCRGGTASALGGRVADWPLVQQAIHEMARASDVMVIEGSDGLMSPLDARHTTLDVAAWLRVPAVVVIRPGDDAINGMLLALAALRGAEVKVAGVVINAYDPERGSAADERLVTLVEKWGRCKLLAVFPDEPQGEAIAPDMAEAARKVDWLGLAGN